MRAGLEALTGDRGKAVAGYAEALGQWRALDLPVSLAMCLTDMAIVLGPSDAAGLKAAEEARAIWTKLGATPLLARLDAISSGASETVGVDRQDAAEPARSAQTLAG